MGGQGPREVAAAVITCRYTAPLRSHWAQAMRKIQLASDFVRLSRMGIEREEQKAERYGRRLPSQHYQKHKVRRLDECEVKD